MFLVKLLQMIFGTGQAADHSLANVQRTRRAGDQSPVSVTSETSNTSAPEEKPRQPFVIILSRMIGDMKEGDKSVTSQIIRTLSTRPGVELKVVNQAPIAQPMGDNLSNLPSVLKTCWGWLEKADADVVVWGELDNHTLRLRFVPRDTGGSGMAQALSFADTLVIPSDVSDSIGDLIYGASVAALIPRTTSQAKAQTRQLSSVPASFDSFLAHPIGLDPEQVNRTKVVSAAIALRQARQDGDMTAVRQVAETLRSIVETMEQEVTPIPWMLTNRHMGDALLTMAEKNNAIPGLEEAALAYTAVTEDSTAAQLLPVEWAEAKAKIGRIMHKLAVGKPELTLLRDSVAAYNEALTVFTKIGFPNRWAEMQNSLGKVLTTYGDNTNSAEALDQAAKLFNNVLTVRSREGSPALWAATQSNIGAVRFSYGKQKQDVPALQEAAESFRLALEVYESLGPPQTIQTINNNLTRVERVITNWEINPPKPLEQKAGE